MSSGDLNNVDRMMRELNVEQLVQIQSSLKGEMDKKREELRRMVGRRYRDVLEASNTVKRLSEIANELASLLANIGQNVVHGQQKDKPSETPSFAGEDGTKLVAPKLLRPNASRCFLLLQNLLSMSFVSDDPLVRAFCLCVADFFHRTLSSSDSFALPFSHPPVVPMFSDQFIHFRMELLDISTSKMGSAGAQWHLAVSALVAYLLLRPRTTADELLQLFLKSRMDFLMENLRQPDSTLLGLIKQMKDTVQSAEQIFAQGALISAIQCVTTKGWSPDIVESFVDNQPMSARKLLKTAIERVNGICPSFELPARSEVQKQCSDWAVIALPRKIQIYLSKKAQRGAALKRNPRDVPWTVLYRRKHKKGVHAEEGTQRKRVKRTVQIASRPIADLTVEALLAQRNQKPEFRKQQREAAIKAAKESARVQKDETKKKQQKIDKKAAPTKTKAAKQVKAPKQFVGGKR